MRNCFARLMTLYAAQNDKLVLLYADIGNRLFNNLKEVAAERTINAGIAEANMATVAAGMAMSGFKPFIYTITPFTTARNFEQIKVDIAYQNQNVTIVGTGSGMAYANLGPTHHSFEDIALMRVLPNMTILCPADINELEALFPQIIAHSGPVYLRMGKKNEAVIYDHIPDLKIGKFHKVKSGMDVSLLVTGCLLDVALEAAELLSQKNIKVEVSSAHTIKPLDTDYLDKTRQFKLVVTLEEHSNIGGLGSAVNDYFCDAEIQCPVLRFALPDQFIDKIHSQQSARNRAGLTADNIAEKIEQRLKAL